MTPGDWLLLLLAVDDSSRPLDPVRLQKGMFLLAHEGDIAAGESYDFRPYDYGPFSSSIYHDIDRLLEDGMVEAVSTPGYAWKRYIATSDGVRHAQSLVDHMTREQLQSARWLAQTKRETLSVSFQRLLRYVYERYPDYAERSIFTS